MLISFHFLVNVQRCHEQVSKWWLKNLHKFETKRCQIKFQSSYGLVVVLRWTLSEISHMFSNVLKKNVLAISCLQAPVARVLLG